MTGKEVLVKNNKTYHWCPYHRAYTIHKPDDCRLATKKQKSVNEAEEVPVTGMTAVYAEEAAFNTFGDEVVDEQEISRSRIYVNLMILLCWLPLFVARVLAVAMRLASKTLCQALNHEHEREQPAPIRISALMMPHRLRQVQRSTEKLRRIKCQWILTLMR